MNVLTAENITKAYSERVLLDHVSFSLQAGEKAGVIGVNGMGKSTLLRIAAGEEEPDEGTVITGNSVRIGYLSQEPVFRPDDTVLSAVIRDTAFSREEFEKESEAKSLLMKLDFRDLNQPVRELSGGQKKRAALAQVLLLPSDILVLDEPTNHLDSTMSAWLEEWLIRFRGTLLMVTHDRYFLDRVSDRILEVDRGKLYSYPGSYREYVRLKQEKLDMEKASERKRQSILRTELQWLARGARARSTKQKAHIQRIEAMQKKEAPAEQKQAEISSAASRMGRKTLEASEVCKSCGNRMLIDHFSYLFLRDDRIGIIGPNGCGKTTLLKILAGMTEPDSGKVSAGTTIRTGYFSQENEYMDPTQRAIEYIRDVAEYVTTEEGKMSASALMERFLFDGTQQWTRIEKLSGGEKRRLQLLHVLMGAPNVLILDEPTNDLDIQTLTILEDYLDGFPGIVIIVSHDRYFLDRTVRRIFSFEKDGKLCRYEGGYSDYLAARERREEEVSEQEKFRVTGKRDEGGKGSGRGKPRHEEKLKFSYKEQREYETIDGDIEALENRLAELDGQIEEAATRYTQLEELTREKEKVQAQLDEKTERWVYLTDLAEKIEAQDR